MLASSATPVAAAADSPRGATAPRLASCWRTWSFLLKSSTASLAALWASPAALVFAAKSSVLSSVAANRAEAALDASKSASVSFSLVEISRWTTSCCFSATTFLPFATACVASSRRFCSFSISSRPDVESSGLIRFMLTRFTPRWALVVFTEPLAALTAASSEAMASAMASPCESAGSLRKAASASEELFTAASVSSRRCWHSLSTAFTPAFSR
mmetsp:Transcript_92663/g.167452  ORF Transcript_92663/g.167452 Transcript_92663/m.167452 type:complete len:214 (-) Transcript_92663:1004-1645(-)